jgi:uncharacterized membrane protein
MVVAALGWLDRKPFAVQLVILALIFDPIGAIGGYLVAPQFGIEPILGLAYGLVIASFPVSAWVLRHAQQQS